MRHALLHLLSLLVLAHANLVQQPESGLQIEEQFLPQPDFDPSQVIPEQVEDDVDEHAEAYVLPLSKPLGEISGLAVNAQGQLIAFHRADRVWDEYTFTKDEKLNKSLGLIPNATVAVIDPQSGQVLAEHGENEFYLPHGMSIDSKGFIWVTDVGSHQVHKLDPSFKKVMSLGEKLVPGNDAKHFCKPTDVAVAKNGFFFVADGYCNSRVMKFDPSGKLVYVFGASGDEMGASDFLIPHSLTLVEDLNLICVADRENERVQCFSAGLAEGHRTIPAGIPITSAEQIGRVYAIREKKHYLIGVTGADLEEQLEPQVFVMDMESGKANTFVKGIENAHSLAVSDDGVVYIAQMHPNQILQLPLPEQNL